MNKLEDLEFAKDFKDEMFNKTMHYQKIYGFKANKENKTHATWNNEADAFKHAFMQAIGTLRYSKPAAQFMAWRHEQNGNQDYKQPKGEENMDTWNNKVGREIADEVRKIKGNFGGKLTEKQIEDIVAAKIMERMKRGDLITHPSDKRNHKDYDKYMKKDRSTGYAANIIDNKNEQEKAYYALEDVGKMSTEEFSSVEDIINRQMEEGTMYNKEYFETQVQDGNLIWVDEYVRDDGTKVKGHYRSKAS